MKTSPGLRIAGAAVLLFSAAAASAQPATNLVSRDQVAPRWFAGANGETNQFWYRVNLTGDRFEFVVVNAAEGKRAPAFDHARLAKALGEKTGRTIEPQKFPFDTIRFVDDGKSVRLISSNTAWQCDLATYEISESRPEEGERTEQPFFGRGRGRRGGGGQRGGPAAPANVGRSPDGKWDAVVRGHNLS